MRVPMDLQIMPVLNASILSQYQYGMERLWYSARADVSPFSHPKSPITANPPLF